MSRFDLNSSSQSIAEVVGVAQPLRADIFEHVVQGAPCEIFPRINSVTEILL